MHILTRQRADGGRLASARQANHGNKFDRQPGHTLAANTATAAMQPLGKQSIPLG